MDPAIPVVLSSFASGTLDAVLNPGDPKYGYVSGFLTHLLTEGRYDAADLHSYHCERDMPAKVSWLEAPGHMPAGRLWISTENGGPDSRRPGSPAWSPENEAYFEQVQAQEVPLRLNDCANNGGCVCLWFSLFDLTGESAPWFRHPGPDRARHRPPQAGIRCLRAVRAHALVDGGRRFVRFPSPIARARIGPDCYPPLRKDAQHAQGLRRLRRHHQVRQGQLAHPRSHVQGRRQLCPA